MKRLCPYCNSWGVRGRRRGHAFVGYCSNCLKVVVELMMMPKEKQIVRRIKNEYLEGKPMPQIAFELNREGTPTWMGKKWLARTVRDVLTNELYVGRYRVRGEIVPVVGKRIISGEEFVRITELRRRFRWGGAKRPPMPEERRKAKIERVFGDHLKFM